MKNSKGVNFKIIGNNIRTIREYKGLTQEELGQLVHCSSGHIKNTESGTTGISLDLLIDLANALDVSTDSILNGIINVQDKYYDNRIYDIIYDCDNSERSFLIEVLQSSKDNLRKYRQNINCKKPDSDDTNKQ